MARMTLEEIRNRASTVDRAKVEATTEAEIEAHRAADGDADLDVTAGARVVESPRSLRVRLGMTQPEIAAALNIPLGTWRNWEQGRVSLEPAAVTLLRLVSHDPAAAVAALAAPDKPAAKPAAVLEVELPTTVPVWRRTAHTSSHFKIMLERVATVRAGCVFGEPDTPQTREFAELLHDPEVQDWLAERVAQREQSKSGA